jgi:cysteine synthase A
MDIREGFIGAIGNTPLLRLRGPSEATGCEILGKAEFANPGGSVKDRTAWFMVDDFERRGLLEKGGVIVEGTAGNTGIGLSLVAAARGYRAVIVMPETQSQEKKETLRLFGADLRLVPAVPYRDPGNYVHVSERLAAELAKTEPHGAVWAQQFDNTANRDGHYRVTGREIWEQTGGRIDGFVSAIGTGGTLAGVGTYLKEKNPAVKVALADPPGAAMHAWFTRGVLESSGSSITEGIGQGRVTKNIEGAPVDFSYCIPDAEMVAVVFSLLREEGLCVGGSAGLNVAGAMHLAKELGPGHTIVTILCDGGQRYQSKLFNPEFLRSKGLPTPDWL